MTTIDTPELKIAGMTKLTLLDYPGKLSAIIFLPGCNMKCPYCHNSEIINNPDPTVYCSMDYVLDYLVKRKGLLDAVVVSGGEPTLHDISPLLTIIKRMGYDIKLDTNGTNPKMLKELLYSELVDYVAMDIKTYKNRYPMFTDGVNCNWKIAESIRIIIEYAKSAYNFDYEFRTTVTDSLMTPEDIGNIAQYMICNASHYYIQPYVRCKAVPDQNLNEPSDDFLYKCVKAAKPYIPSVAIRGRDIVIPE